MKNSERLYLDIHVLQTVPPSCVNRDDTGSPKTAVYGGVMRARVSSQSWKRAMRKLFEDILPQNILGVRTLHIVEMVEESIKKMDPNAADPAAMARNILNKAGVTTAAAKEKGKKTKEKQEEEQPDTQEKGKALFFMSRAQAEGLARLALDNPQASKAQAQKALNDLPGVDVALFGRMVADDKGLNVDACAQVAHSLSTHRVSNEFDYFTAVDDMAPEDTAGAGHIGTVEFNSSTLYRYATLAVHELHGLLAQGTAQAAQAFVDAFVRSMPTGKQNTFANRTLPDAVLVCLRRDQPVNLVGAFERPVIAQGEGYAAPSVVRLAQYAQSVYGDFVGAPELTLVVGQRLEALGQKMPLPQLLEAVEQAVAERLPKVGEQP